LSPGAGALETTFRPAEDFGLVIRLIRRFAVRRRYAAEAAKFAYSGENNFMVESVWSSICDSVQIVTGGLKAIVAKQVPACNQSGRDQY
jgi:hypothetical protein